MTRKGEDVKDGHGVAAERRREGGDVYSFVERVDVPVRERKRGHRKKEGRKRRDATIRDQREKREEDEKEKGRGEENSLGEKLVHREHVDLIEERKTEECQSGGKESK